MEYAQIQTSYAQEFTNLCNITREKANKTQTSTQKVPAISPANRSRLNENTVFQPIFRQYI
jgi:hypothetical protein